jgi:succinoglycan biosynthesis transport protein ExoP
MDFQQYLLALQARRKVFLLVFAAILVTAVTVALVLPKRYDAIATVLLDARDEQSTAGAGRVSPRERAGWVYTQVDLIQSGKVANRVVRDLKLAQQPGVREQFESETGGVGTIEDWLGATLLEKLKVDTGASNVLIIKYSSGDAAKAAAIANGFAKAYLDTALELRTEPSREAADWFEEQLKGLRVAVTQTQSKLTGFQKDKGILGVDERMDIEYARLTEISTQLSGQKNATYDAQTRYKQASDLLASGSAAELPEVLANGYIITVKAALQAAEGRLEEQSQSLGANHPQLQRTQQEVQGLKERLTLETKKVIAGLGNAAEQGRKREKELEAAYQAQQDRIMKMKDTRVELAVMTRDVDNAQKAYDAALGRFTQMKLESKVRQTNLAMLTPAIEPVKPAQPKVGMIIALALILGALLAAGVVYLLEMIDRRVRSRSDLEARLAVPTLGKLSRWQQAGGRLLPAPIPGMRAVRALPHPW